MVALFAGAQRGLGAAALGHVDRQAGHFGRRAVRGAQDGVGQATVRRSPER